MLCLLPVSNFLWNTGTRKPRPLSDSSNRSPGWSSLLTSVFCFWCSTLPLSIMSSSICCDRKLFIDWSSSIPSAWSLALVVSCLICCAWLWTVAVNRLICCNWFSSFDVCISICRVRSVYFDFNPSICCDWSLTTPRRTSTWSWVASSPRRARSKWCSTCNSKWDLALLLGNCNAEIKSVKHSINVPQIRILKKVRDSCYVLRSWLCRFRNVSISFFFLLATSTQRFYRRNLQSYMVFQVNRPILIEKTFSLIPCQKSIRHDNSLKMKLCCWIFLNCSLMHCHLLSRAHWSLIRVRRVFWSQQRKRHFGKFDYPYVHLSNSPLPEIY